MKVLDKDAYASYKEDPSFYDKLDISEKDVAFLERFTPAHSSRGTIYTCKPVVVVSGEELQREDGTQLGTLWKVRTLAAASSKGLGLVERHDMLVISVNDQAFRLTSEGANYADGGYHLAYATLPHVLSSECVTVVDGVNVDTAQSVTVDTPTWFISDEKMVNPLL